MNRYKPVLENLVQHTVLAASKIDTVFASRREAGQKLADVLSQMHCPNPAVIAVPMGGVPVAFPICDRLCAPLQLAFAKKVPFSSDERFGIGAVSGSGNITLNTELIEDLHLRKELVQKGIEYARSTVQNSMRELVDPSTAPPDLSGKTVVLVDDGIATGYTILSAAKDVEALKPASILIASPVVSEKAHQKIHDLGYEQIALVQSDARAFLVDNFYESFSQLSIDDIRSMLPIGDVRL